MFTDLAGAEPGLPDGIKVDSAGKSIAAARAEYGYKKLGRIVHGQPQTTNLAFGGADWKTLYFTYARFLGSVNRDQNVNCQGADSVRFRGSVSCQLWRSFDEALLWTT